MESQDKKKSINGLLIYAAIMVALFVIFYLIQN